MDILIVITLVLGGLISMFGLLAMLRKSIRKDNEVEFEKLDKKLDKKFVAIDEKIDACKLNIDRNELDRISHVILRFADKIRTGEKPNITRFKNIYEIYEKYKELGGNQYVDQEKIFIDQAYETLHGLKKKENK